jgi:hypothetical protein
MINKAVLERPWMSELKLMPASILYRVDARRRRASYP